MKSRMERMEFRRLRTRSKVFGTHTRPRLAIHRSLKHIYAQVIDDIEGRTLAMASTREKELDGKFRGTEAAQKVGALIGERAIKKGISQVVFDRGARLYHGRVKALADSARQAGLKF